MIDAPIENICYDEYAYYYNYFHKKVMEVDP